MHSSFALPQAGLRPQEREFFVHTPNSRQFVPFDNVDHYRGLFVCGENPAFMFTQKGYLMYHNMTGIEGSVRVCRRLLNSTNTLHENPPPPLGAYTSASEPTEFSGNSSPQFSQTHSRDFPSRHVVRQSKALQGI